MDYEEYMETARYATMTLLYEPNIESSCVVVQKVYPYKDYVSKYI